MRRPRFEVGDVFRRFGPHYRYAKGSSMSQHELRVMTAIETCRTAALGGHLEQCDECGHQRPAYNSCRNRHCPKCQSLAKTKWLEARLGDLLPVEYFHVVFTLPDRVASIALQNKRTVYNILFRATAETLSTIAADTKHLGAQIGFLAVLHTWGQNLMHHPHLHCVIPGGGFHPCEKCWVSCQPGFFLPVRVLSRLFRQLFLDKLDAAFQKGALEFHGSLTGLRERACFKQLLDEMRSVEWVVYAKPPFGGPQQVLDYLGRYTHRVAISNNRLVNIDEAKVSFRWKDYRRDSQQATMTLEGQEFIRRFLLHTLPNGFVRIRHFGFLANRHRASKIELARELLGSTTSTSEPPPPNVEPTMAQALLDYGPTLCPKCQMGRMVCISILPPEPCELSAPLGIDSS